MLIRFALISAALVSLSLPIQAHDIYSHLTDERGGNCCDDKDCRPAIYRFVESDLQMFVGKRWINVPNSTIQDRALMGDMGETDGGHWCGMVHEPSLGEPSLGYLYITRCAILPPQSASHQIELP
jgi:hypothetical protein